MCMEEPIASKETRCVSPQDNVYNTPVMMICICHAVPQFYIVSARIADGPEGVEGISLFIVPKLIRLHLTLEQAIEKDKFFDSNQSPNDIKVKRVFDVGGAACTYADIEFGADTIRGASAFILGKPNEGVDGIRQFVTLNNIQVALSASSCALSAYRASLDYAKNPIDYYPSLRIEDCFEDRVSDWEDTYKGVDLNGKDEKIRMRRETAQGLIDRPDIRRMLLAQKAYAEGGMALCVFCTVLDDVITHDQRSDRYSQRELESLLRLLSPIAKAWVTEHSLQSVDMACRIFDGMGVVTDNIANNLLR